MKICLFPHPNTPQRFASLSCKFQNQIDIEICFPKENLREKKGDIFILEEEFPFVTERLLALEVPPIIVIAKDGISQKQVRYLPDFSKQFPKLLKEIVLNGLVDRVAMDIKSSPENYSKAVGIDNFDISSVAESKEFLLNGEIEYEFRTTVVKGIHTKEDLINLAKWISGAKEYYLQQFKDSGNLISPNGLDAYTESEINNFAEAVREYVPTAEVRGI